MLTLAETLGQNYKPIKPKPTKTLLKQKQKNKDRWLLLVNKKCVRKLPKPKPKFLYRLQKPVEVENYELWIITTWKMFKRTLTREVPILARCLMKKQKMETIKINKGYKKIKFNL